MSKPPPRYDCPRCGIAMRACNIPMHLPMCLGPDPITIDALVAISRYTVTVDGCWEWGGQRTSTGYGRLPDAARARFGGERNAHRAAYMCATGPIPDGLSVLHECDNPPCFNPAHLEIGTQSKNIKDSIARGRFIIPSTKGVPSLKRRPQESVLCPSCGSGFERPIGGWRVPLTCGQRECANALRKRPYGPQKNPRRKK
jgi:hypothetical protein